MALRSGTDMPHFEHEPAAHAAVCTPGLPGAQSRIVPVVAVCVASTVPERASADHSTRALINFMPCTAKPARQRARPDSYALPVALDECNGLSPDTRLLIQRLRSPHEHEPPSMRDVSAASKSHRPTTPPSAPQRARQSLARADCNARRQRLPCGVTRASARHSFFFLGGYLAWTKVFMSRKGTKSSGKPSPGFGTICQMPCTRPCLQPVAALPP